MRYILISIILLFPTFVACVSESKPDIDVAGRNFELSTEISQSRSEDVMLDELENRFDPVNPDPELLLEIASRYLDLNHKEKARETIIKAIDINPDDVRFSILHANTFADEGKIEEAETIFAEIYQNEPENYESLLSWGVMFYNKAMRSHELDYLDKAVEKYIQVIKIDESNYKAYFNLALIHQIKNETDEARKYFDLALEFNPEMINAILHLARIEAAEGNWDKCHEYAVKGLEIKQEPELVFILGQVAFEKKNFEEAELHFARFLTMNYVGPLESVARARLLEIKGIGQ